MSKAIILHEYGGPEVLKWEDYDPGEPGPGEVRIRHSAMGLNFRDTYHRTGSYKIPGDKFPAIIGGDGAGVIEAIGPDVTDFSVGQRVCYGNGPMGSYAQVRLFPTSHLFALPDNIPDQAGAALLVKGFTAHYLIYKTFPVQAGQTILIHAIAGGTGIIMCQLAKMIGASVIGTTSTSEKAELAKSYGCDHVINYTTESVPERVRDITDGVGVPVVYDGVGLATYEGSLDSLAVRGTLVGYGNASGNFPPVEPLDLMDKGSLYFTRTRGNHFIPDRPEMDRVAGELFDFVGSGKVKIEINKTYPLEQAPQAHIDLEARKTSGCVVYLPE
ncbi:MAG: quinone oxidoreductase [Rhodospirillaceae bacterium]|nr:quinone oxidoreductase [Rhodospirillaceae bacterium]MBT4589033.1 quinone oxidoreductase [Rhodospirillaceae bacterium]MBT4941391.1 quinone oxidoreductase [Rhodospirillaceae bacterium]MBT7955305.1 quinone oxidoreductase [Rhodospirillaceae bacterium]